MLFAVKTHSFLRVQAVEKGETCYKADLINSPFFFSASCELCDYNRHYSEPLDPVLRVSQRWGRLDSDILHPRAAWINNKTRYSPRQKEEETMYITKYERKTSVRYTLQERNKN